MSHLFTKNTYVDEVLAGAVRYNILENGGGAFKSNMQINLATSITTPGTALNATRMNNLESGVDLLANAIAGGWVPAPGTWSYSSLASPNGVVSANQDVTQIISKGMRFRFDQVQALTAYWNMDANSNSQVGSHNGTDTSMTYTAGKFSNAATFNGTTSKIVITDHANLKPTGEFTLGLWFKSNTTGTSKFMFQSYSANTSYAGFHFRIGVANTLEAVFGKNTGTGIGSDVIINSGTTTVTDNQWHYAVLTYKNNIVQVYLDGVLEIYGWTVAPVYAGTNYVRIGCANTAGSDSSFMNGQIDDIFLINGYALDEKTIRDQYRSNVAQGTGSITVTKHGLVNAVGTFSGSATLVTLYTGTDFSLANSTITNVYYSPLQNPFGFNKDRRKWSVSLDILVDITIDPTASTVYNLASVVCPMGEWIASAGGFLRVTFTTGAVLTVLAAQFELSTGVALGLSSLRRVFQIPTPIVTGGLFGNTFRVERPIVCLIPTTYNLLVSTNFDASVLGLIGSAVPTEVRFVSALL